MTEIGMALSNPLTEARVPGTSRPGLFLSHLPVPNMWLLVHLHLDEKDTEHTALCSRPQGREHILRCSHPLPRSLFSQGVRGGGEIAGLGPSLHEWQCPWRDPNFRAKSPCLPFPPPHLGSSCSPEFPSQDFAFPCCEFMCQCVLTSVAHSLLIPKHHPKQSSQSIRLLSVLNYDGVLDICTGFLCERGPIHNSLSNTGTQYHPDPPRKAKGEEPGCLWEGLCWTVGVQDSGGWK